jgi:hypothetical protein
MKRCGKCGELKPFTDFYKSHTKSCGYGSYCKPCQHEHYKQRYHYRTRILKQAWQPFKTEYRDRNRLFVLDYLLGHPCVDCGERDPVVLDFDHVRGVKKAGVCFLANIGTASLETLRAEIEKCEVRCANCHRRKTAIQFDWKSKRKRIFRRAKQGKRKSQMLALDFPPEYSCLVLGALSSVGRAAAF